MPTSFLGLFLFSIALSLVATFSVLGVKKLVRIAYPPRRAPAKWRKWRDPRFHYVRG